MSTKRILSEYKAGLLSIKDIKIELERLRKTYNKKSLSEGQKGLFALQKIHPEISAYNCPICLKFFQEVNLHLFESACQLLIQQYPILKTRIKEENGLIYQMNDEPEQIKIHKEDISYLESDQVDDLLKNKIKKPFNFEMEPLFRIYIFKRSENETIVLLLIHHIIFDGGSAYPLIETLLTFYKDLLEKKTPQFRIFKKFYEDFISTEISLIHSEEGKRRLNYWKKQLQGFLQPLKMPSDYPRPTKQSFQGKIYQFTISAENTAKINNFCKEKGIYQSAFFMAAFLIMLNLYTKQEDIIVGMPIDERLTPEYQSLIGFFINMIPIRGFFSKNKNFRTFLKEVQQTIMSGMANAYPFSTLLRELKIPISPAHSPIFQVGFFYQNFLGAKDLQQLKQRYQDVLSFEEVDNISQEGEYELALEIFERDYEYQLKIKYDHSIYKASTISRMANHYSKLIEGLFQNPNLYLNEYCLLSKNEEKTLLVDWNNTYVDYAKDKCIHELFEKQSEKTPESIAVVYNDKSLTYKELNNKSTILAKYLQQNGIELNELIAICVERSMEMVIGLLGILKAGGAYVPLDPDYPQERLAYMLEDSKVKVLLTQSKLLNKIHNIIETNKYFNENKIHIISLDEQWKEIEITAKKQINLNKNTTSDDLIYVMYTSGSTGNPKGVMLDHKAICNRIIWMQNEYELKKDDKVLQKTPFSFDVSGWEFYWPLLIGARLIILPPEKHKDPDYLRDFIRKHGVTVLHFVPSMLQAFLFTDDIETCTSIKKVFCSGEALTLTQNKLFFKKFKNQELHNLYGPTEAAIDVTYWKCGADDIITPIGKPISNIKIYIIDELQRPVPIGVPGELCISGDGLAKGYLNKPELTIEKFIDNPFNPKTKLYKTGDLARWLSDGNIEYLGRIDHQIKLRGFRIELGEIESILNSYPEIDQAIVVLQKRPVARIVAYFIPSSKNKENQKILGNILSYAKSKLPEHMVPSFFIPVENFLLTPNGKVDRKYLEHKKVKIIDELKQNDEKPILSQSNAERKILKLYTEVLDIEGIETNNGFFEVGGNSILAVTLAQKIQKKFQINFTPADLFKYNTIRNIGQYIVKCKSCSTTETPTIIKPIHESSFEEVYDLPEYYSDSLAIIGISCQVPDAENHWKFWENIKNGKESINLISKNELQDYPIPPYFLEHPNFIPALSSIQGKNLFDPEFFNLSSKSAMLMDPQFRLLLIHAWQAIEDAGYVSDNIPNTSVFISASNQFHRYFSRSGSLFNPKKISSDNYEAWILQQTGTIPTMISYKLGLKGKSTFIHSNCSSALTATQLAYQSLNSKEVDYALVGAASLFDDSNIGYIYHPELTFSSSGHVKTFDANADGMIAGEGVCAVLLKRAKHAIEDGDHIYALFRGIEVNNDGSEKAGFYTPSVRGQSSVIQKVLKKTQINPESIEYIEAHGTGTALGDAIEFLALSDAYKEHTIRKQYCCIGSLKPNIGHLDAVAGLAGLIKTALCLYHGEIPPLINYSDPNPQIDIENSPFYINKTLKPWLQNNFPRRACLNSFGIGGTNAHAILEEYKTTLNKNRHNCVFTFSGPFLIPLSARKIDNLKEYAKKMIHYLESWQDLSDEQETEYLARIAYTMQTGRKILKHRLIFLISNKQEFIQSLKAFIEGKEHYNYLKGISESKNTEIELFDEDEDTKVLIQQWTKKGKLKKIAKLWANGTSVEWKLLYLKNTPTRLSLPTYPFSEESYALPPAEVINDAHQITADYKIDPLLHKNTSYLGKQRFSSRFTGKEYFLKDHNINGKIMFPEFGFLEMAMSAVKKSIGAIDKEISIRFNDVIWSQPLIIEAPVEDLHIDILKVNERNIRFIIYTEQKKSKNVAMHAQGIAEVISKNKINSVDIGKLKSEMQDEILKADACYQIFKRNGFYYGSEYQGIQKIYKRKNQVLAEINLLTSLQNTIDAHFLHPNILTAAVQASMGITLDFQLTQPNAFMDKTHLSEYAIPGFPSNLESLEIFDSCKKEMYAWVINSVDKNNTDPCRKYDIFLMDKYGNTSVKINKLSYRLDTKIIKKHKKSENKLIFLKQGQNILDKEKVTLDLDQKIKLFIYQTVADLIHRPISKIDTGTSFFEMGLSSAGIVTLIKKIENILDRELSPLLLFEHPSLSDLITYLKNNYNYEFDKIAVANGNQKIEHYEAGYKSPDKSESISQLSLSGSSEDSSKNKINPTIHEILINLNNDAISAEEAESLINNVSNQSIKG